MLFGFIEYFKGIVFPINLPGLFFKLILFLILNFCENKSTLGVSKWPKVGKHVGGIIPFFVFHPTRCSFWKLS